MGKEHALVISNHRSDIDWLVGWVLAQRSGCLGSTLAVMKKSSKFLPVIGWSMWFSEYLFLERSWAKDESTLKSGLQQLRDFPLPFWLALFVEGTRFTQAKLLAAQEYAASAGLPIPRNVLIPRTKVEYEYSLLSFGCLFSFPCFSFHCLTRVCLRVYGVNRRNQQRTKGKRRKKNKGVTYPDFFPLFGWLKFKILQNLPYSGNTSMFIN
ncbi:1-acyl-sn-glycerol-3-phosphate acyltransferase PLS1 isoform X1 [Cajanus cajan]|uniref:1-acyl-sn-glycerol-3-phosphate acyltransferase PLS1 n=1 Tax=Cajanus cajan TaxID=3821 RepID=A0A151RLR6_CAJCA|nr:1-acyl-sn-glycerol-3-phosphate acyltransferase PLS1 isoform X1 [Cajanus cajan]KYP43507.1 1-acyl-sn-glycerol-3-phosphate acyltransferase PLS1 [Cajanus cajan]